MSKKKKVRVSLKDSGELLKNQLWSWEINGVFKNYSNVEKRSKEFLKAFNKFEKQLQHVKSQLKEIIESQQLVRETPLVTFHISYVEGQLSVVLEV